ncbi:MAG: CoB--CoM heterodisulfide reductase iron-sulfur subunit A family protein [Candidatus Heimdallarchaeota archaeon]|nr:CoB--CoM heterodisulfide reductase iron-sulfur subunit A family protein [Candidatus Heimdallarchaeota archaeon]
MSDTILVIGGGPAGLEASRGVAELGYKAILVEKNSFLGGMPIEAEYAALTPDFRDAEEAMNTMINPVLEEPNIEVFLNSTVGSIDGEPGNFTFEIINADGSTKTEKAGAVIVATGFKHFDPAGASQHWGYYEYDDVLTLADCEKMLKAKKFVKADGTEPERVAFVQCVGSRDRQLGNQWCSKVCCGIACKEAIEIRELLPNCRVYIFYIDLRAYGFWEDDLYWKAQEEHKVNFIKGVFTEVIKRGDKLVVKGEDTTMGRPMEIPMDMVILSVGMEPSQGTLDMANMLHLPMESHGYIATTEGPLNTVQTERPGVFAVGAAIGPADLEDTISSAGAAAMKAVVALRKVKTVAT